MLSCYLLFTLLLQRTSCSSSKKWKIGVISEYPDLYSNVEYKTSLGYYQSQFEGVSVEDVFEFLLNKTSFSAMSSVCRMIEHESISVLISYVSCYSSNALVAQTDTLLLPHLMLGTNSGCSFHDQNLHHILPSVSQGSLVGGLHPLLPLNPDISPITMEQGGTTWDTTGGQNTNGKRLFTVSLGGSSELVEEPLIDFIVMRNWTRLVLVHDNTMSNGFDDARNVRFRRKLAQTNVFRYEIDTSKQFEVDLETELSTFNKSDSFEHFVVIGSGENCRRVMDCASHYNMFTSTFTWILACPDADLDVLMANHNITLGTIILFKPEQHIFSYSDAAVTGGGVGGGGNNYDLQLKLNMSFQILFNSFSELTNDQIVPPSQQSESTRKCGLNTTWTSRNGMSAGSSDLMDSIDKHHTKAISSLLHKSQTKFNLYIFDVQRSFWGQHGTWSRKRGFESDHELFHPPTQNFKKIRVVTVVESPFVEVDSDESGQLVFSGFCVDLLDEVSKQLNFQYIMYNASEYGRLDGHSWVGAVGEVAYKRADIAVSGMLITSQREEAVDFSTRFMDYGVGILIRKTTPSQTVFGFLQPLNPQVWTCVASTIFIAGGVMFLVTRISPNTRGRHYNRHGHSHGHGHSMQDRYVDPLSDYSQFTFRNSIWFTMTSIMQQGGDLHPKSGAARIMGCFWWFFTLIITATYTANLAAFLTVNRMETPIDSLQSLVAQNNVKYGTVRHSPIHLDFKNQSEMNALYERIANYLDHQHSNKDSILVDDAEEGYRRVREGGYAFMWDNPILQWMKAVNCEYMTVGKPFLKKGYGIAVQKGTILREEISKSILKLEESGVMEKLRKKWFVRSNSHCQSQQDSTSNNDSAAKGIELSNVAGIFYVLIFGTLLAFLVGIAEIFWQRRSNAQLEFTQRFVAYEPHRDVMFGQERERPTETSECIRIPHSYQTNYNGDKIGRINYEVKLAENYSYQNMYQIMNHYDVRETLEGLPDGCTLRPNGEILLPPRYNNSTGPEIMYESSVSSGRSNRPGKQKQGIILQPSSDNPYKAAIVYSVQNDNCSADDLESNVYLTIGQGEKRSSIDSLSAENSPEKISVNGIFQNGMINAVSPRIMRFEVADPSQSQNHSLKNRRTDLEKTRQGSKEATV